MKTSTLSKAPLRQAGTVWPPTGATVATALAALVIAPSLTQAAPASPTLPARSTTPHSTTRPFDKPATRIAQETLAGTRALRRAGVAGSASSALKPRVTGTQPRKLALPPAPAAPSITSLNDGGLHLSPIQFTGKSATAQGTAQGNATAEPVRALPAAPSSLPVTPATGGDLPEGLAPMAKIIAVSKLRTLPGGALPAWMQKSAVSADAKFIAVKGDNAPARVAQAQPGTILPAPSDPDFFDQPASIRPTQPVTNSDQLPRRIEVAVSTFVVLLTQNDLLTVAVADPDIADVAVVNARAVLVNGKSPGVTSLVLINSNSKGQRNVRQYQVSVTPPLGQQTEDVQGAINIPGVAVTRAGDALILEGEVESAEQASRALEIAKLYSDKVLNKLTLPSGAQGPGLAAQVQDAIGLPDVTVRLINGKLLLSGSVGSEAERERANKVAAALMEKPEDVINLLELPRLTIEELRQSLGAVEPGAQNVPPTGPMGIPTAQLSRPQFAGVAGALQPDVQPFISVRQVGDQVILEGYVLDETQAANAAEIAARTGLRVVNRLHVAPAPPEGEEFLNSIAAAIGRPGITVRGTAQRLVLEGTVANTNEAVAIEQIARAFSPNVDNLLMTPDPQMVDVDVAIYEINRDKLNSLGITYTSLLDGPANPVGFVLSEPTATGTPGLVTDNAGPSIASPAQFRTRSPFQASLRAMVENNNARLLSNPRTTVLSSRTATFQVGGQVPIPGSSTVTNAGATTEIVFKDFGILVDVIPVASESGAVTTRVRTEVSQPDFTIGVTPPGGGSAIPGFTRRATVTEVTVPPGGTIALAGLIQHNITELTRKVPILGDIPILGQLFRSKRFQHNESELVIFVTPRVLPNTMPEGTLVPAAVYAAGNTSNEGAILGNSGINVFNGPGTSGSGPTGSAAPSPAAGGTP